MVGSWIVGLLVVCGVVDGVFIFEGERMTGIYQVRSGRRVARISD